MGSLAIRRVAYHGDKYYFQSPYIGDGVVVLEGENGNGKSTFMDLIYYGLGGKVSSFNVNDKKVLQKHNEIYKDSNNYVELEIEIDDNKYEITRSFSKNIIYIVDENKEVFEKEIYRNKENDEIFSDWILGKLGIDVFDMVQGTKQFKIGFTDLMRLIYHDQRTELDKIYKHPDNDNFITDSTEIRKAIFEVLIGEIYNDYYYSLGQYKLKLKEYEDGIAVQKGYEEFLREIDSNEVGNSEYIREEISENKNILEKIKLERKIARNKENSSDDTINEIKNQRNKINILENEKQSTYNLKRKTEESIDKIISLIDESEREIKEIEKIRFVNRKLRLFSPNTCPYCLAHVHREEGKCICGNSIEEETYEKFFYTDDEYLEILKSKNRSKESMVELLKKKRERLDDINSEITNKESEIRNLYNYIADLTKDINSVYNSAFIRKIDDRIQELSDNISSLSHQLELAEKRDKIIQKNSKLRSKVDRLKLDVDKKLNKAQQDIIDKRDMFNKIYDNLMKYADKNCYDAFIGEDYMPCINSGMYRERSALVSKRLIYFLTLLILGAQKKLNYPNFLMLDTPNKEGIDSDKLINILQQLNRIDEYVVDGNTKYQIILTTGTGVYPEEFKDFVFLTLDDKNKLLKVK